MDRTDATDAMVIDPHLNPTQLAGVIAFFAVAIAASLAAYNDKAPAHSRARVWPRVAFAHLAFAGEVLLGARHGLHDMLNTVLHDGDTIIVSRAETVYVFGQVKNPGAYALQQKSTSVLQALSLGGGVTDRGSTSRVRIVRIVNGEKKEIKVKLTDVVQPGDTVIVGERFF